jgi:hypothetical protein
VRELLDPYWGFANVQSPGSLQDLLQQRQLRT